MGAGAAAMNSPVDPGARQALKKQPPERTPEVRAADPARVSLPNGQHFPVGPKLGDCPPPRTSHLLPGFSALCVLTVLAGGIPTAFPARDAAFPAHPSMPVTS